ncbi:hypothetical protein [Nocardioides sp. SYSU DS0663]|uniref:hypothetical protein n=1 Tax=Nocardioides sp. SYSU DS0663 TaxID=3416445 RepID=UPI003F4C5DDE
MLDLRPRAAGARRPWGLLATALLGAAAWSACGADDAAEPADAPATSGALTDEPSPGGEPEQGSCAEVIPADVLTGLGWSTEGAPEEGVGGCEWAVADGLVVVASEDGTLEQACAELEAQAGGVFRSDAAGVAEGLSGCADRPEGELGLSTLLVAGEDGAVRHVRIAPRVATDPAAVDVALERLSATSAEV